MIFDSTWLFRCNMMRMMCCVCWMGLKSIDLWILQGQDASARCADARGKATLNFQTSSSCWQIGTYTVCFVIALHPGVLGASSTSSQGPGMVIQGGRWLAFDKELMWSTLNSTLSSMTLSGAFVRFWVMCWHDQAFQSYFDEKSMIM